MDQSDFTPTKTCKHCGECKRIDEFNKKIRGKHGVRAMCKKCQYIDGKKWRKSFSELSEPQIDRLRWCSRRYEIERNKRGRRAERQAFYLANKDRLNARTLAHAKKNPAAYAARAMRRIAIKKKATPHWSETDQITALYVKAAELRASTGVVWHVDHIVPLNSSLVCGLHVIANLRVITATENLSKGNTYWPDMP